MSKAESLGQSPDQMISILEDDLYTWGKDNRDEITKAETNLAHLRSQGVLSEEQQKRLDLIGLLKSLDHSEP